jgi:hypothetical protein
MARSKLKAKLLRLLMPTLKAMTWLMQTSKKSTAMTALALKA